MTESENKSGLDNLKKSFEQEKKSSNSNLYQIIIEFNSNFIFKMDYNEISELLY